MFNPNGQAQDGFLRTHDVFNLKLSADLVVLSACRSAFGRDFEGEGLVNLTRGFMYAGVPRVVGSLWSTEDKATAELMVRFYRGVMENLRPAAALCSAQIEMLRDKRWQAPYYWAGFTLEANGNEPRAPLTNSGLKSRVSLALGLWRITLTVFERQYILLNRR
jgi:CHAT domain-containing protein